VRGPIRNHAASIFVFLIAAWIVLAQSRPGPRITGPGSGGGGTGEPPAKCKNEDALFSYASGWLCGGPGASASQVNFCQCVQTGLLGDPTAALAFEWNLGQAPKHRDFVANAAGGLSIQLSSTEALIELPQSSRGTRHRVTARLAGAHTKAVPEPLDPLDGRVNYLLGSDPKQWITDVPTYRRIQYRNVYRGVDLIYYGHGRNLEHDFVVSPGADPQQIRFQFEGAGRIAANRDGDLTLTLGDTELLWKKPFVYQTEPCGARKRIEASYRIMANGSAGFELGAYDPKRPLVIDPEILLATYLGRNGTDIASRNAVDASGNIYITGGTLDGQFPISPGAFRTDQGALDRNNVMIAKFRPDGGALVYSTYIGGQSSDIGLGIAVDPAGNIYSTGVTLSNNFPVTEGAYQRNPGNPSAEEFDRADCFVFKLNAAGNALLYSTYLGGRQPDGCTALAVDSTGSAYVTGATASINFPVTEGAFQSQLRLGLLALSFDGFLTRLNPAGSGLVSSTFFGGNGTDIPAGLAIDRTGNAYVTGATNSTTGFPVTQGSLQTSYKQVGPVYRPTVNDAFVLKFNPDGKSLLYGTYLGGGANDVGYGISVDAQGSAYICGSTESRDLPVTAQAYQSAFGGGGSQTFLFSSAGDAFAAKLNPTATELVYATYLGGTREDRAFGCIADEGGDLHITGHTTSTDFPVSTDARQRTFAGTSPREIVTGDAFYTRLNNTGRAMVYSSYYGGTSEEAGFGITRDAAGAIYISGGTTSAELPSGPAPTFQRGFGGGAPVTALSPFGDAYVVKWGDPPKPTLSLSSVVNAASFIGANVAPGEWVVIAGAGIGPETAVSSPQDSRPPTQLSGVRVLFDGVESPLLSVSATRITAIVPFGAGAKDDPASTQLIVEYNGNVSPALPITLVPTAPGLFTVSASGRGQASVVNEDGSANSSENPAVAGSIVTIFGTGAGLTDPPSTDGNIETEDFPPLAAPVSILIGETAVEEIFFSGGAKGKIAGIFQVQFRLPAGLPAGDLDLSVRVGDRATQSGITIAIAEAAPPPQSAR